MIIIYALRSDEGKSYIGCTAGSLAKRMREHRCLLRSGQHQCNTLQAAWREKGEFAFKIEAIQCLPAQSCVQEKRTAELYWMEYFDKSGLLYNEYKISFRPPDHAFGKGTAARVANGYKHSPESNLKRSIAQLGIPKGHGAKISATKQARKIK